MTGLVIADRVKETTATTGTGTINLAGAATQFQSFISAVGTGNQCNYCLLGGNGSDWETGLGTVTSGSPNTLSRTTVLASSNSGSLISLTGTSTVFLTEPATALTSRLAAPIVKPPPVSSWTQQNFGTNTTFTNVTNGVSLFDLVASSSEAVRAATMSSPSTPYTIDANLASIAIVPTSSFQMFGIGWTNGTALSALMIQVQPPSNVIGQIFVRNDTNYTTFSAAVGLLSGMFNPADLWLRIADNGTNITASVSADGVSWVSNYTVAKASGFLGSSGYSSVGVFFNGGELGNGGSGFVTLRSWYQH